MHNTTSALATRYSHSFAVSLFCRWSEDSQPKPHVHPCFLRDQRRSPFALLQQPRSDKISFCFGFPERNLFPTAPTHKLLGVTGVGFSCDNADQDWGGGKDRKKHSTKLAPLLLFESCFFSSETAHSVNSTAWDKVHSFSLVWCLALF